MSYLQIGRMIIAPPIQWYEAVGDPITNLGGQAIPAPRQALRHQISISTLAADGYTDSLSARLIIRRQLRSMLNNTPLKLQGYLYVIYSDDPDQNGWYAPDFGQLADGSGAAGLASGWWNLEQMAWIMVGHRRINREARNIWSKDLRTGLFQRDYLGLIYTTDLSAMSTISLLALPAGATSITNTVSGQIVGFQPHATGRDGGSCPLTQGIADLSCVAYDRPDATWGLSDVIVYDRQGATDAPSTGPGPTWVEAYGPDFAWNWIAATPGVADTPVLDNQLSRVRYNPLFFGGSVFPEFSIDLWNGSSYIEMGKVSIRRISNLGTNWCDTWISAGVAEYTPDRAVIKVVMAAAADAFSRETVYITMQRGQIGATFEVYPALESTGTPADALITFTPTLNSSTPDANVSVAKIDGQGQPSAAGAGVMNATAGTGAGTGNSGIFSSGGFIGASNFTASENWIAILRCQSAFATLGPWQTNIIVVQGPSINAQWASSNIGYGISSNIFSIFSQFNYGYVQAKISFTATVTGQVLEAEAMTLGTGTSTSSDATASGTGNNTTTCVRTTDANVHISTAALGNTGSSFRCFVRAKVTAGQNLHLYSKYGAIQNTTITISSSTYIWVDLGEVISNGSTLEIHAWVSGGTGSVDRMEMPVTIASILAGNAPFSGPRHQAWSALVDSRADGCVVAR